MDSRDFLIIGAVAVAAFLYYRSRQPGADAVPAPSAGVGTSDMTSSAAATTTPPIAPPVASQVAPASSKPFNGFSAMNMGGLRFTGATVSAVIADAIKPPALVRPSWYGSPTTVGGAGVFAAGASDMGPQPKLTTILPPSKLTSPVRY